MFLKNAFPTQVEDSRNIIRRAIDGKNYIHKYIQAAKPTGKVYLVGHSRYLESFIATKYENDHPVDGVFLENCQIYETKLWNIYIYIYSLEYSKGQIHKIKNFYITSIFFYLNIHMHKLTVLFLTLYNLS